jgi:hypothetical protein
MSVKPINDDKKFSLVIKNIDHNSHRAYKYAKDPKHSNILYVKLNNKIQIQTQS